MLKKIPLFILLASLIFTAENIFAEEVSFSISPTEISQGDPILVELNGTVKLSDIKKLTFNNKRVATFIYNGKVGGLIPIDLNKKAGDYELVAETNAGQIIKNIITVKAREKYEAPLGIPEKLGGDTKASQDKLVSSLAADKQSVTGLKTNKNSLWKEKFTPPLKTIYITSPYGYSRKTGEYSIAHKGTDYRAKTGTEVLAINRGVVRITKSYRNYGKSVFIDHGQGLVSYYLHLSKYKVKVGQVVERGQVIAESGNTGYSIGAHLHLGIKLNEITIDPERFFEIFK